MSVLMPKRALISVSDKAGVLALAQGLTDLGVVILSTGGTAKLLADAGIAVTEVGEYTGFPEIMDGRVKTLHPKIHGGILGRRGIDDAVMAEQDIAPIDLVVVNLYPFKATIEKPDLSYDDAIENIDIGGPAMVRATAKNHAHVCVVVNPQHYSLLLEQMQHQGGISLQQRFAMACEAFAHTAQYDGMIANFLTSLSGPSLEQRSEYPKVLSVQLQHSQDMRYGENPHQSAGFYKELDAPQSSISQAASLQGKALSFNNIADADAALECVRQFDQPACVIVKHANPCGVALAANVSEAYDHAYATDPESAFGGIIAFNQSIDGGLCQRILDQQFVEVLMAPDYTDDALEVLASKPNIRALKTGRLVPLQSGHDYKRVTGGLLVQARDDALYTELQVVTQRQPSQAEMDDLVFAWQVAKYVKSNAIIYANEKRTIGVGAGQMSRVNSARIAAIKAEHAGLDVNGAVMASDAFFPFRDGIDNAAANGIAAVIQPGGSMRDEEIIAAANEHNIAMVFTGMRHFRH